MKFPRGFPKPRHYFAMKRRGMLPPQTINIPEKQGLSDSSNKAEARMPWWGWVILLFGISALLRLCGYGQ